MFLNRDLGPAFLRETFGHVPSGVAALCTLVDGPAGRSPRNRRTVAGIGLTTTGQGALFLSDAGFWLDCSVETEVPGQ